MRLGELRQMLAARGLAPRVHLGQNFLVDPALLRSIPGDAGVREGERVVEVGPGAGGLTAELLAAGARVCAVEFDRGLAAFLRECFAGPLEEGRLRLIEGDVLAAEELFHPELESWWTAGPAPRMVANLPYAISGPLLARLPGRVLAGACLLLQKEVAEKVSDPASGPLGVRLALAFQARLGRRLPPAVFWPRPQVASAFLHLEPRAGAPSAPEDALLASLLREAFSQRRKRLLPRLRRTFPAAAAALEASGIGADTRPEELRLEHWRLALGAMMQGSGGPSQRPSA